MLLVTGIARCDDEDSAVPSVPAVLADGSRPANLPAALRRFRDRPVLGAKEVGEDAVPFDPSCRGAGAEARFSDAWLSTEGLTVTYVTGGTPFACDRVFVHGRWRLCGVGSARSREPRHIELAGGGLDFCFRAGSKPRYHPFMWIAVPRATPWVLVDHYRYWVAYRTAGRRLLRISGLRRARDFRVKVVLADETGKVLRERTVRGYVAG